MKALFRICHSLCMWPVLLCLSTLPAWVFNFGIGRGLTRATDRWTLKWIFEVPLS